jgi:hypothetical protein
MQAPMKATSRFPEASPPTRKPGNKFNRQGHSTAVTFTFISGYQRIPHAFAQPHSSRRHGRTTQHPRAQRPPLINPSNHDTHFFRWFPSCLRSHPSCASTAVVFDTCYVHLEKGTHRGWLVLVCLAYRYRISCVTLTRASRMSFLGGGV